MNCFKRKALSTAVFAGLAIAASGCATVLQPIVKNDLASAAANFEQAVQAGVLPVTDPAVVCTRAIMARAAADVSLDPQISGIISASSVAYIAARVVENRAKLPAECNETIGRLVIDGAKAVRGAVPGILR